jgi:uncharacterized protein
MNLEPTGMAKVTPTIIHFEIPANDVESLRKFYSAVFGWKFEKAPMTGMEYWVITTGPQGKSVGGGMYKKVAHEGPRNFIAVADIDEAVRKFSKAGGREIVGKQEVPGMGWSYIGTDPEGNTIALWEARMPATQGRQRFRRTAKKRLRK